MTAAMMLSYIGGYMAAVALVGLGSTLAYMVLRK